MLDMVRDGQVVLLVLSCALTLGLATLLWFRLRRVRVVPASALPAGPDLLGPPREAMVLTPGLMRQAFRHGFTQYRQAVAGSSNPYLVPWILAVGTRGGGTSALCAAGGSASPPAAIPDPATGRPLGCAWWFYDRAVVIDVAGEAFADLRGERLPDGAWTALLEEVVAARDGLPIDGILLTLPVPDLAGPEALPAATLAAKAAEIHGRLWQAQKVTGLCLPVWLVLTMADAIPGFQALVATLPPDAQDGAFGWSNPYPLEASFQSGWIGEAIDSLQDAAAAAGLELGAAGADEATAAAMMRLPVELDRLRAPLATFLGVLLRQTGYQESLFFRGLWLTGASGPPLRADQPPPLGFVRGLLARKVFAERDLPRPVPRWSLQQDRRRKAWRIATAALAAVLALLIWSGAETLAAMRAEFVPALRAMAGPVALTREAAAGAAVPTEGAGPLAAFRAVGRIDGGAWHDPPWPVAALDATAERVRTALAIGHWRLVMGEIRAALLRRGATLGEGGSVGPAAVAAGAPELRALRRFLGETLLLERATLTFNRLAADGGTVGLAELLHYTHGIELPTAYVDRAAELGFAAPPAARDLRNASVEPATQAIDPVLLRQEMQPKLLVLARTYLAGLAPRADGTELQRIAAARLAILAETPGPGAAERLQAATEALAAALDNARRDPPGLAGEGMVGGAEFAALMRVVTESRLLGPTVRDAVLRAAEERPDAPARGTVLAIGTGPLLVAAPERNRLEPSAGAAQLETQLAALAARAFMHPVPGDPMVATPAGLFRWAVPGLEAAAALAEDHALFELRDLPAVPEPLRPGVQRAAAERLAASLASALARAQLPAEPRNLAPVAEATRMAQPVLVRLLAALRAAGATEEAARLAEATSQQAQRVLNAAWAQLEAGAAYQPPASGRLVWVEGRLDPAALYLLSDAALLPARLGREREKLLALAAVARPMLGVLDSPELGRTPPAIAERWRAVIAELDRASQGRPGSLAALERLIGEEIPAITAEACADLAARGGGDWFVEQAIRVRGRLRALCRRETGTRGAGAWATLEESFTRLLAGRYPFAPIEQAQRGPYATAEQVAAFYAEFDAQAEAALAALPSDRALAERARHFIETMRQARGFLTPLLGLGGAAPGVALTPHFRALPDRAVGNDAIIEWRVSGRSASTGTMSARQPVPWRVGEPLSLSLRWARNAPVQPVQVLPEGPRATAGTVTVAARDPWALVTLVRRLAPSATDWQPGPGDPGPILGLAMQTAEGDAPSAPLAATARAFTSLAVTPQGAATRLAVPTHWPVAAPRPASAMAGTR